MSGIGNAVWGEGTPTARQWLDKQCHQLKHEGPAKVLEQLRLLQQAHPNNQVLTANLTYLEKREEQMQYPRFQQEGWPIGSGVVESANKVVVQARLKGAGMHWERSAVNPMLALRNVVCNDRWKEAWPHMQMTSPRPLHPQPQPQPQPHPMRIHTIQHQQTTRQPKSLPDPLPNPVEIAFALCTEKANRAQPWRPAPNHPWRRYKTPLPTQHAKL